MPTNVKMNPLEFSDEQENIDNKTLNHRKFTVGL